MGGKPPAHTSQVAQPAWKPGQGGNFREYDKIYGMAQGLYIDPITGKPMPYGGPSQAARAFDPYEQMGYARGGSLAQGGQAGGYAQQYMQDLYGNLNPLASQNIRGAMGGQFLTPTSSLQGADRLAAQNLEGVLGDSLARENVDAILRGERLDPKSNPAMQRVMDAVGKQVRRQRGKATSDASAAFSQSGTLGSSGHRRAQEAIERNMDETIADSTAQMMSNFYNQQSGARDQLAAQRLGAQNQLAQQVGFGSAQNRMGTAGSVFNLGSGYDLGRQDIDANRLMQLGAYQRGQITDPNLATDFANRNRAWAWQQDAPMNLANIIAMLQRGSGQVTDTTQRGGGSSAAATGIAGAGVAADVAKNIPWDKVF
mgnify:CR=1 FL=1